MTTDFATEKIPARTQLLALLTDGEWKPWTAMRTAGGMRYSARLLELKRLGYQIESRGNAPQGKEYRLTGKGEPKTKQVKVFLTEEHARRVRDCDALPVELRKVVAAALRSFESRRDML